MLLYLTPYRFCQTVLMQLGIEPDLVGIPICEQWHTIEVTSLESLVRQHLYELSIHDRAEVEVSSA